MNHENEQAKRASILDPHGSSPDLDHAIALVHECKSWITSQCKGVTAVQIDPICGFDSGSGKCGKQLAGVIVLVDECEAHAVTYCRKHVGVMLLAVSRIRGDNGACVEHLNEIRQPPEEEPGESPAQGKEP